MRSGISLWAARRQLPFLYGLSGTVSVVRDTGGADDTIEG